MAFLNTLPIVMLVLVWMKNSSVAAEIRFYSQPINKTVLNGDSVNFSCGIDVESTNDSTRYRIDWKLDHLLLTTPNGVRNVDKHSISTNTRIKGEVLKIEDAGLTDRGHYYCAVYEDDEFRMYSKKGYLTVFSKVLFDGPLPYNDKRTVYEGESLILNCRFYDGPFNVSWYRNEVKLIHGYNFIIPGTYLYAGPTDLSSKLFLKIRHVKRSFTGSFRCHVFFGKRLLFEQYPEFITVLHPPDNIYPRCSPQHLQVYGEEDVLQTTCFSRGGNVHVHLSWIRDGNRFEIPGSSVNSSFITNEWTLTRKDNGTYIWCAMTGNAFSGERVCRIGPIIMHNNKASMHSVTETMYETKLASADEIAATVVSSKSSDKANSVRQADHVSPATYSSLATVYQPSNATTMLHSTTSVAKTTTPVFEVTPNEMVTAHVTCIIIVLISLFIVIVVTIMAVCVRGRRTPTSEKTGMNLQVDPESMNEGRRDKAMNSNTADKVHYDVSSPVIQI